jgi:hypothetical protein
MRDQLVELGLVELVGQPTGQLALELALVGEPTTDRGPDLVTAYADPYSRPFAFTSAVSRSLLARTNLSTSSSLSDTRFWVVGSSTLSTAFRCRLAAARKVSAYSTPLRGCPGT